MKSTDFEAGEPLGDAGKDPCCLINMDFYIPPKGRFFKTDK